VRATRNFATSTTLAYEFQAEDLAEEMVEIADDPLRLGGNNRGGWQGGHTGGLWPDLRAVVLMSGLTHGVVCHF
jgi:hypothetical protein